MATYLIPECNIETLRSKMDQVRKKCEKYGCEFTYKELEPVFKEKTIDHKTVKVKYIKVEAEGHGQVNGWEYVATVEHLTAGNVFRKYNDIEIPDRYKNCGAWCEHCNKIRSRKDSYIIRNSETNEFKMIGKSCLRDFTGGFDAERVANLLTYIDDTASSMTCDPDDFLIGGGKWNWFDVIVIVKFALATIDEFGYAKNDPESDVPSTSTRVKIAYYEDGFDYMGTVERGRYEDVRKNAFSDKYDEEAKEIINYFRNLTEDEITSDYLRSMHIMFCEEYLATRNMGYAVSAVPTYRKHKNLLAEREERKKATANSEYVGEIKERLTLTIKGFRYITSWDSGYGITYVYQFIDTNDNVFVWYASNGICDDDKLEESTKNGETFTLIGTVKNHTEYKGTKQTVLTRCKINEAGKKVA